MKIDDISYIIPIMANNISLECCHLKVAKL